MTKDSTSTPTAAPVAASAAAPKRGPKKILRLARTTTASWSALPTPTDAANAAAVRQILQCCAEIEQREAAAKAAQLEARAANLQRKADALRAAADAAKGGAFGAGHADDDEDVDDEGYDPEA